MCAKKRIDGLERDFQPAQAERSMRARVQAHVAEFLVGEFNVSFGTVTPGRLRVANGLWTAIPAGTHLDGRAIHRIKKQGTSSISAQLQLDRAESPDDDVFEHLLGERAKGIVRVGRVKIVGEDRDAVLSIRQLGKSAAVLRLNPPFHSGDAIFYGVDRLPRDRRLGK